MSFRVVLTDRISPDVEIEREMLARIDADLVLPASGSREHVLEAASDADALLNTYFHLSEADIARLSRCKVIARYGIGVDNIDCAAAVAAGIVVTNVPDYCIDEVATHTVGLIIAAVRRFPAAFQGGRSATWSLDNLRPIRRMSDLTFGVVGMGRIGRRVVELLRPFRGQLLTFDPFLTNQIRDVESLPDLNELISASDVITLHLPLTMQTRGLIGPDEIARMQSHAILVNTSRGGLVRTRDLVDALRGGRIGGVALDVLEHEADDAALFASQPNAIITPHMAYYSEASEAESRRKATEQVIRVLTGRPAEYQVS